MFSGFCLTCKLCFGGRLAKLRLRVPVVMLLALWFWGFLSTGVPCGCDIGSCVLLAWVIGCSVSCCEFPALGFCDYVV